MQWEGGVGAGEGPWLAAPRFCNCAKSGGAGQGGSSFMNVCIDKDDRDGMRTWITPDIYGLPLKLKMF